MCNPERRNTFFKHASQLCIRHCY